MSESTASFLIMFLFFAMGLYLGAAIAERNPPDQPKPTKWTEKLKKEYEFGYNAGVKATLNQMRIEIKRAEK